MAKQRISPAYTFIDPNTPREFEHMITQVLVEKLLARISHPSERPE